MATSHWDFIETGGRKIKTPKNLREKFESAEVEVAQEYEEPVDPEAMKRAIVHAYDIAGSSSMLALVSGAIEYLGVPLQKVDEPVRETDNSTTISAQESTNKEEVQTRVGVQEASAAAHSTTNKTDKVNRCDGCGRNYTRSDHYKKHRMACSSLIKASLPQSVAGSSPSTKRSKRGQQQRDRVEKSPDKTPSAQTNSETILNSTQLNSANDSAAELNQSPVLGTDNTADTSVPMDSERKFVCDHCEKDFTYLSDCNLHQWRAHLIEIATLSEEAKDIYRRTVLNKNLE